MYKAQLAKQLMISVDNKVGTMAELTHIIASSKVNLVAVCAYAVDNKGMIMFMTEDNEKSKKVLKSQGYDVREEEVVLLTLENKPGALTSVTEKIAQAGIDLTLVYGSVEKGGKNSRIVLVSEDNETVVASLTL